MQTTHTFPVKGMHCSSCAQVITKKVAKLPGVAEIHVQFATETASVVFDDTKTSIKDMNTAISPLGYSLLTPDAHTGEDMQSGQEADDRSLRSRVEFMLPLTIVVFLLMMWDIGHQLFSFVPKLSIPMEVLSPLMFVIATLSLFWAGTQYLRGIWSWIRYRTATMDTLVGIGTLTAYVYSSILLLFPQVTRALSLPGHTYFDVTIVVIGFVLLGEYLQKSSKHKTGEAIRRLLSLAPKTARVVREDKEVLIPIDHVVVGDRIIVSAGETIPVDGVILSGETSVDESMITGESLPVDRSKGDSLIGGTINMQGTITYQATRVGNETVLAQITRLVQDAQNSKAPLERFADKVSAVFVPAVMSVALISTVVWLTVGSMLLGSQLGVTYALLSFVGILVIACPCALGLATPTAVIVGIGKAARRGILIKDAESLELLSRVDTIVFDKTGTLTKGDLRVTEILPLVHRVSVHRILSIASSLEAYSHHPLAQAIVAEGKRRKAGSISLTARKEMRGIGVSGKSGGKALRVIQPPEANLASDARIVALQKAGNTVVIVEEDGRTIGAIALSDEPKSHAYEMVKRLHAMGMSTLLLTGDNQYTAENIARQVGISRVYARVTPDKKLAVITALKAEGHRVAMVGDGINDAPALAKADVGIALGSGTDVAIASASITLIGSDIQKIVDVKVIADKTVRTMKQNLFWAFAYNVIGIPIAAGVLYPVWGIFLNPVFAGLAMALSSVSVVSNSLLLGRMRVS